MRLSAALLLLVLAASRAAAISVWGPPLSPSAGLFVFPAPPGLLRDAPHWSPAVASGHLRVVLGDAAFLHRDQRCRQPSDPDLGPCGADALAFATLHLAGRLVHCRASPRVPLRAVWLPPPPAESPGDPSGPGVLGHAVPMQCSTSRRPSLAAWLVRSGYALPRPGASSDLLASFADAVASSRGLWARYAIDGFADPDRWMATRLSVPAR